MASRRLEPGSEEWFARDAELNELVAHKRLAMDSRRTPEERLEMTLRLSALLIELSEAGTSDDPRRA